MDIRTLPEKERGIYNKIKEQYSLSFDSLTVKDKKIRVLKPADIREFLGGNKDLERFFAANMTSTEEFLETLKNTDVTEFPFWARLWDAAVILSYLLSSLPNTEGKKVLELGAGLGAPGLAAAALGMDVTISDYEELIMDFERVSAAASGLDNVSFELIDWFNPPELAQFDILCAAEVLFRDEFFEPLLSVFKKYLKEDGEIWLAHDATRKSLPKFLQLAAKDFDVAINKQEFTRDGQKRLIIVNRLKRKK